jgi:hypothetical protein
MEVHITGNLCSGFLPPTAIIGTKTNSTKTSSALLTAHRQAPRQHCARGCACFRAEAVWGICLDVPDLVIRPFRSPLR